VTEYEAEFNDGRTAARHHVSVTFDAHGLRLTADPPEVEGIERQWPYGALRLIDPPRPETPLRLTASSEPDARLRLDDPAFFAELQHRAPHLFLSGLARPNVRRNAAAILAALLLTGLFLWQGVPRLSAPLARLVPVEWEQKIGRVVRKRLLAGAKTCEAELGGAALSRLTRRLTSKMEAPPKFVVTVADRGAINAFAMPGGNILIFRGLLQSAESADEVAAVLAHELGHVHHRHPTQMAIRSMGVGMITDLLTGDGSALVELAGNVGGVLLLLSYSRDMRRADLSTHAMVGFFDRLRGAGAKTDGNNLAGYFSSHPPLSERIAAGAKSDGNKSGGGPALNNDDWQALKNICG